MTMTSYGKRLLYNSVDCISLLSCQEPLRLDTFYLYGLIYVYVFLSCVHNGFVYMSIIVCMFIL